MSGKGIDNSSEQLSGNDGGYVIVVTRWNTAIVDGLLGGAMQACAVWGLLITRFGWSLCPVPLRFLWPAKPLQRAVIVMRSLHWAPSSGWYTAFRICGGGVHARHWRGGPQFGQAVAFGVLTVDTWPRLRNGRQRMMRTRALRLLECGRNGQSDQGAAQLMAEHNALAAQRRKARHYGLQALYQWTSLVPVPLTSRLNFAWIMTSGTPTESTLAPY